jgi:RNA polymerase sigma-70 factor, ECF subfamily
MEPTGRKTVEAERLTAWVRDHGRAVRGYLLAMLRRPELADDLAQEVFYRAWRGRDGYREQGHARAYLLRIADRVVCDRIGRKRQEATLGDDVWKVPEPAASNGDPAAIVAGAEAIHRLDAALARLTPTRKRVLLLRFYGQLDFQEIADAIGCPLSTALSHCHRGLQALRQQLAEENRP